MDQEEIMNLDLALQEDDVGSQTNTHLQDFVARKKEMGWEEVHKAIKGAPFFALTASSTQTISCQSLT